MHVRFSILFQKIPVKSTWSFTKSPLITELTKTALQRISDKGGLTVADLDASVQSTLAAEFLLINKAREHT